MKSSTTAERVKKHRDNLRRKGLKPVQIWVPDVSKEGFKDSCKQQAILAKQSDRDASVDNFLEETADLRGWE